ncbi:MAG: glycosyltransferase [Candidatus Dojkabacteria bacterium]
MPVNNQLKNPRITVFIPAHNEEKLLGYTLEKLKAQDIDEEFELLVIDNASIDKTGEIARNEGARVVREEKKGNRFAVERGFKEARGDIVIQTDADTSPAKDFVRTLAAAYDDPEVVGAGTRVHLVGVNPLINKLNKVFSDFNPREGMWGPSLSARKWAWKEVGGFNKGFDLNSDSYFGFQLAKIGKVKIIKDYYLPVSGRRYTGGFFSILKNAGKLVVNGLFMIMFKRPLFKDPFEDIR